jgi:pre-rRNA-processing protein TSR1
MTEAKGRLSVKSLSKANKKAASKNDRRNHVQQLRKQKRDEVLEKKRTRGGQGVPPFLVAVIGLSEDVLTEAALEIFKTCDEEATVITNDLNICHISVARFKQRFSFMVPAYGDLYGMMDAAKIADCLLLMPSVENGIDDYGDYCLSCLFAQGLPATVLAVQGLRELPLKKQAESKKFIQKHLDNRFRDEKLYNLDSEQDGILALRAIGSKKMKKLSLRDKRPHIFAEAVSFELSNEQSREGTLKISGYLRGQSLSVNGLVHLPGWGDFQMTQIDAPTDPYPLNIKTKKNNNVEMESMDEEVKVLEKSNPLHQESLVSENVPDPMDGEQTWPTEEEMAEAELTAKKKQVKRVPKGTSDYQAAWIVDSGDEQEGDDDDDESMEGDEDEMEEESEEESGVEEDEEEYEDLVVEDDDTKYDATVDMDEEQKMLEKLKEARNNEQFPDEIDTPQDVSARIRFQRYRGLKSFRTSEWDPKENLPADFSKIFQFKNFRQTKKRIMSDEREGGAMPGWYITLHIDKVPREFMESYEPGRPIIAYGMLPHEQKMSVVNFVIKRHHSNNEPIKSKERMIFHVGYRRFAASPVYSQHTNGTRHKYERFLSDDGTTVATVYAPILFPPATVIMFKEKANGNHELIATGSVLSVNPDRIVAKRVVLSGHPFKINKRSAVIRYMFFNREDIVWFKPVELRTKYGKRGHIKEPLGTHGHMKCIFDGALTSMDSIFLNLYKRVFPKWTYEPRLMAPPSSSDVPEGKMDTDVMSSKLFD